MTSSSGFSDDRERVREACSIIDVIEGYFPLIPDGRNFKALCPFHSEKTPSFKVDPARGTYHCFGCHERGDAFSFVMKMESIEFRPALELLAERAGVTLSGGRGARAWEGPGGMQRSEAEELLRWSVQWFQKELAGPRGVDARRYLRERGFRDSTLRDFSVGYAPPGWSGLADAIAGSRYPQQSAVSLGLLKERPSGGVYDAFRDRIVFPIRATQGRVVGFGARRLKGEEERGNPKYLNSPESALFMKGELLYGLHEGGDEIRRRRALLLMEGYTDVLMAHQEGFPLAAATLGTALTSANVERACRFADRVFLVFDGDEQGRKAAMRAVDLFLPRPVEVRVVILEGGRDPCELLLEEGGAERFRACVAAGKEAFAFLISELAGEHGRDTAGEKERLARACFSSFDRVSSEIQRRVGLGLLAREIRMPMGAVERDYERWRRGRKMPLGSPGERAVEDGLPGDEDALMSLAISDRERMPVLFALYAPERFRDPILRALALRLRGQEGELSAVDLEDPREKSRFLALEESCKERGADEAASARLLRELILGRLEEKARGLRQRLEALDEQDESRDPLVREWLGVRGEIARLHGAPELGWEEILHHVPGHLEESLEGRPPEERASGERGRPDHQGRKTQEIAG
ncbi:MAG: DNA primase [Planctomycetota bacterium]